MDGQQTRVRPIRSSASRGRSDAVAAGRYAVSRRQARRDACRPSVVAPLRTQAPRTSMWLFMACGVWLVGLGAYFVFLRPALLPEDPRFMGTTIEALRVAAPGLEGWLGHVFNVMGGFMVAAGTMTILVAWRFLARRAPGTLLGSPRFQCNK